MSDLITASEARSMREQSILDFNERGMVKVIKHINKLIEKATSEGACGIDILYRPYLELDCDRVLGALSDTQIKEVIKHLEDNGYRAWVYNLAFYLRWDDKSEPEPEPKPQENSWYTKYTIWRTS